MNKEPYQKFKEWFDKESALTKVRIKTACCLSTIGIDGYPNARFVSLKDITREGFIVTGTTSSKKGIEIETNNKVALTFWWTETEKQIRIQGDAQRISDKHAERYFKAQDRKSTRLNSSHVSISYAVFCLKKKTKKYSVLHTA